MAANTSTASRSAADKRLARYRSMRDFNKTPEPRSASARKQKALSFVIQKHAARRLHYDFRLEMNGVLVSWAVPKGPSYDPTDKRLAVHVEDHPLSYGTFEGTIPAGQYGAGHVMVWDSGTWEPVGDPRQGLKKGKLAFTLHGQKLQGLWELVKIARSNEKQEPWLLFKKRDAWSRPHTRKPAAASKHGMPAGAIRAALPQALVPQLATLAKAPPTAGRWIYEVKFDGYRILARIDKGKVRLLTRNGHDWTAKMPHLVRELQKLELRSGWLDGEIIVHGRHDAPDFNALQKAVDHETDSSQIQYFLFDLPFLDGFDLRGAELAARRELLQQLLEKSESGHVLFSAAFEVDAATVLAAACSMHLEGVIAKRADSTYASRRAETWLKLKCKQRQEFVIGGYVDRSDDPKQIGSLLLGIHDDAGNLVAAGAVGTGWSVPQARALKARLQKLRTESSPFSSPPKKAGRWTRRTGGEQWVKPRLIAEVEFAEWTPDNQIRHASFVALRSDKPATSIVREVAKAPPSAVEKRSATERRKSRGAGTDSIKVTHGERVIDPVTRLTKLDLVRYYEFVAPWILPHLKGRPCSIVRAPSGVTGQIFFQKHAEKGFAGIRQLDASLWPDHEPLLEIDSARSLVSAAQMNVVEFHTWNSLSRNIDRPDRMIFDLDPGEGTPWTQVQEAATLMRALLQELELDSWLKTSGGKGLHVVVPLAPKWNFDVVKAFSKVIVQHLARNIPSRFVAKSGPANRVGKLFVDYLRNGHGATTAAAFSARARRGLGVSMPVSWDDLQKLTGGAHWTIANAKQHLEIRKRDPWAGYGAQRQSLTEAMQRLSFRPSKSA